jgi:predicted nucleic acid-binding protein
VPATVLYLDASALVKLVIEEAESSAVRALVAEWRHHTSSRVASVEVPRAARRASGGLPEATTRAVEAMAAINLVELDAEIVTTAATLEPFALRALDAIHLASALSLGDTVGAFVAYDRRLIDAAHGAGMPVLSPR